MAHTAWLARKPSQKHAKTMKSLILETFTSKYIMGGSKIAKATGRQVQEHILASTHTDTTRFDTSYARETPKNLF